MSYKIDNFLVKVSPTDTKLHIRDGYGIVRWTVDAFDITTSFVNNNLLTIKLKSTNTVIILDFLSKYDSKSALKELQTELDTLRVKTPINVDPQIIKYIDSRQLSGPTGSIGPTGSMGPIGVTGPMGPIGYSGATGSVGATGSADRYTGTSSTSLQVPTIDEYVTFQTQPDLSFTVLQDVLAVGLSAAYVFEYVDDYVEGDTAKYFIGQVDSYNSTTGELNLIVTYQQGYGLTDSSGIVPTYSFWYLNLSGKPGESLSINTPFNNAILTSDGTPTGVNVNQGLLFDGLTFSVYADVINYQRTHFQQVSETVYFTDGTASILSSGTASYNLLTNNSAIWYHYQLNDQFPAGTPGAYVADFSNVPTDKDGCVTLTITIDQTLDNGNTSYYYPSSVVINGTPYTIYWANGAVPSPALGNIDVFGFTVFIKSGLIIKVIGQSSTFATL